MVAELPTGSHLCDAMFENHRIRLVRIDPNIGSPYIGVTWSLLRGHWFDDEHLTDVANLFDGARLALRFQRQPNAEFGWNGDEIHLPFLSLPKGRNLKERRVYRVGKRVLIDSGMRRSDVFHARGSTLNPGEVKLTFAGEYRSRLLENVAWDDVPRSARELLTGW